MLQDWNHKNSEEVQISIENNTKTPARVNKKPILRKRMKSTEIQSEKMKKKNGFAIISHYLDKNRNDGKCLFERKW